jgi:hypothetical protein
MVYFKRGDWDDSAYESPKEIPGVETFDHLPPLTDVSAIDGAGVFHVAAERDSIMESAAEELLPIYESAAYNNDCYANQGGTDWQPFDGRFREGVEYRSKDGTTWYYESRVDSCKYAITMRRLDNNRVGDFMPSGRYYQSGEHSHDITHQRRRHAEAGENPQLEPNWLERQIEATRREVSSWPQETIQKFIAPWLPDVAAAHATPAPDSQQPAAGREVMGNLVEGKTPWQFACDWYDEASIVRAVQDTRLDPLPFCTTNDEAFGKWLTNQYRLAMNKGMDIALRSRAADFDAMEQRCEAEVERWRKCAEMHACELADIGHANTTEEWLASMRNGTELKTPLELKLAEVDVLRQSVATLTAERDALQERLDAITAAVGGAKGGV